MPENKEEKVTLFEVVVDTISIILLIGVLCLCHRCVHSTSAEEERGLSALKSP